MINIDDPRLSSPTSGRGKIQRFVLELLEEHRVADELPTSARFVFYELEGRGLVHKSARGQSRRGGVDTPREVEVSEAPIPLSLAQPA